MEDQKSQFNRVGLQSSATPVRMRMLEMAAVISSIPSAAKQQGSRQLSNNSLKFVSLRLGLTARLWSLDNIIRKTEMIHTQQNVIALSFQMVGR